MDVSNRLSQLRIAYRQPNGQLVLTEHGQSVFAELMKGRPIGHRDLTPDIFRVSRVFAAWASVDHDRSTEQYSVNDGYWVRFVNSWLREQVSMGIPFDPFVGRDWLELASQYVAHGFHRRLDEVTYDEDLEWFRAFDGASTIVGAAKEMFRSAAPEKFVRVFGPASNVQT